MQCRLTRSRQVRQFQHVLDFFFAGTVEHRSRKGHALLQVTAQLDDLIVVEGFQIDGLTIVVVVYLVQEFTHLGDLGIGLQHVVDLLAQTLGSPTQMGFQNLADVHARWHAQRVQHHVDRRTVRHVWHVFHGHDARYHTLVTVATGHLVTGLQTTLDRHVYLDHLLHTGL